MKNNERDKPVDIPITGELDLHTFSPKETKSVVSEYISECNRLGIKELRIVHGKGRGIKKNIVHNLLKKHPLVSDFHDAHAISGGWGATIVYLNE